MCKQCSSLIEAARFSVFSPIANSDSGSRLIWICEDTEADLRLYDLKNRTMKRTQKGKAYERIRKEAMSMLPESGDCNNSYALPGRSTDHECPARFNVHRGHHMQQASTTFHNHPQPSTTIHNHPQPSTTIHNHLPQQPSTTFVSQVRHRRWHSHSLSARRIC